MKKRKLTPWGYVRRITQEVMRHPSNRAHPWRALGRAYGWQVRKRVWPRPVDREFEGFRLRCYPDSQSASNLWYFTNRYDHDEMDFLDRYLRLGDHVLDVGANIGTYSLFMARRIGVEGRIDAFEPNRVNAERLRENVALNGLGGVVSVHEVAVTDEVGEVAFSADLDVSNRIQTGLGPWTSSSATVAAERIDAVVGLSPSLSVAKIDVEGAEAMALKGAEGLLAVASPPVWLTEVLGHQLKKLGSTVGDVRRNFADHGFAPYYWSADRGTLEPVAGEMRGNVVFVSIAYLAEVEARLAEGSVD